MSLTYTTQTQCTYTYGLTIVANANNDSNYSKNTKHWGGGLKNLERPPPPRPTQKYQHIRLSVLALWKPPLTNFNN